VLIGGPRDGVVGRRQASSRRHMTSLQTARLTDGQYQQLGRRLSAAAAGDCDNDAVSARVARCGTATPT